MNNDDQAKNDTATRKRRTMIYIFSAVVLVFIVLIAALKGIEFGNEKNGPDKEQPVRNLWDEEARRSCIQEIWRRWENTESSELDQPSNREEALVLYRDAQGTFAAVDKCEPKDVWIMYRKCCKAWSVLRNDPEYKRKCKQLFGAIKVHIEDKDRLYIGQARRDVQCGKVNREKYEDAMQAMLIYREMMDLEDDNLKSRLRELYMEIYLPLKENCPR